MHIVGIDLSINYPAFCVCEDFDNFEFFGFINDPRISNVKLQYILDETAKYDGVNISHIATERKTCGVYHMDERNKLLNYHRIIGQMILEIRKKVSQNLVIAMEGISYGSKGSALVDICMLTGALRLSLLVELLGNNANRMFIFAPSELKNAIGLKGNATKTEVLAQFLEEPGIPAINGCGMQMFMKDHVPNSDAPNLTASEYVYNSSKDEVGSPFNDMIDAYLSVLKIKQNAN